MKSCYFKASRDITTNFGSLTLGNNINKWPKVGRHDWPSCMISDNFKKVILLYVYYMGHIDLRYRVYHLIPRGWIGTRKMLLYVLDHFVWCWGKSWPKIYYCIFWTILYGAGVNHGQKYTIVCFGPFLYGAGVNCGQNYTTVCFGPFCTVLG